MMTLEGLVKPLMKVSMYIIHVKGLMKMDSWKASCVTMMTAMDPNYTLPPNVALITLQEVGDGTVLLKLAHLYEAGEDPVYSKMAKVEVKKIFTRNVIKEMKEMSLSTNQEKSEIGRMKWKVEGDVKEKPPSRGGPIDSSSLVVELGPMEIRTFLLSF
ncbi:hypothetical protein NE237_032547 [Protea cynaroides]|uniref:Glycosyl hydrolases family 38 C-terminal domain-containing protein n=1 Tax=Protea cynaroides TaxID=273540 RepID=A0A9Q0L3R3_9MAGN|nr:hypothetical protein NE237_032547 [Protea cynaroides]